jgi:hypothetical protein
MARRKVGKISTGGWIAIGLGGAALLYLATKPKTTTTLPPGYYPTYPTGTSNNSTASIVHDASNVANNLLDLFW